MELTGYDTVLVCDGLRTAQLRAFADRLAGEWPELLVSTGVDRDAPYLPWRGGAVAPAEPEGDLYLVRDESMRALQDEYGYAATPDGAGPVAVLYRRMAQRVAIRLVDDPAELVGRELFEVTLITAADPGEDRFAAHVLDLLAQALLEPAPPAAT